MVDYPNPQSDKDEPVYDLVSLGQKWKTEIERANRYFQKYFTRCEKIEKIYLAQIDEAKNSMNYPMLWANISTLQPAIYARTPQPAVERRNKDKQPVARTASEMVERVLTYIMDTADIDSLLRQTRDDYLLFARGVAWLRYESDIESTDLGVEITDTAQQQAMDAQMLPPEERITDERVCVDYVHWSDFLHSPCRRWEDVTWCARRVYMDDDELEKRFGKEVTAKLAADILGADRGKTNEQREQNKGKTGVREIWCKTEKYTVWIADGSFRALDVSEPPLDLTGFFPCPKPSFGTTSTGSLIPVPDYVYYQTQCDEIDRLTKRIAKLTDQLRLKVFYPAGDGTLGPAIEKAMRPENDTIMVPVPEWAAFTDKGGSKAIVTLPIDEVQSVVVACISARKQLIDDVYQITGISDIIRGDTEASETATAQALKDRWGAIRIRDRQSELGRFARDIVRISGEIICKLFQPETMMAFSGMMLPSMMDKQQAQMQMQQQQMMMQRAQAMGQQPPQPDPQQMQQFQQLMQTPSIDEVMKMLRDDNVRGFAIDIETDSTIEPDENAEKQRRMEFAKVIGGFIQQAVPIAQQVPEMVPAIGEVLLFVARGFRAGRQLENTLEEMVESLSQKAAQPPTPPPPSPDEQIKLQTTQVKAQAEAQKAHMGVVAAQADANSDIRRAQIEEQTAAIDHGHKMAQMARQGQIAQQQHNNAMQQSAAYHNQRMQQMAQQANKPQGNK